MTFKNLTDHAAAIRTAIKTQHGWTSRDVSVRTESYSLGSSINVTIKNPNVPMAAVKAIAESHESISRCSITGEILSGGNRYVHVGYSREACDALTARALPAIETAAAELKAASENTLIPIPGTEYMLGRGRWNQGFAIWKSQQGHQAETNDERGAALYVAIGSWNQ